MFEKLAIKMERVNPCGFGGRASTPTAPSLAFNLLDSDKDDDVGKNRTLISDMAMYDPRLGKLHHIVDEVYPDDEDL